MLDETEATPTTKPRVTVLCGFLGAGKTTLLNHLLSQAEGRRWAAVVNDVAAINIDAGVVRAAAEGAAIKDVVELGNGCVCCSSRDELGEALAEIAAGGNFDHILVETTGVALPGGVAALFTQRNHFGRSLADFASLSALVSVVDAAHFLREWRSYSAAAVTRAVPAPGQRPVFELMIEQVECADVLVLNKCDLVSEEELAQLEAIVRGLNERAEIARAERGQIASEFLLGRERFDAKTTLGAARWVKLLNASAAGTSARGEPRGDAGPVTAGGGGHSGRGGGRGSSPGKLAPARAVARAETAARHADEFGIGHFVYEARRPFAREKLRAVIEHGAAGLLRAKGYFWIAEQPDEVGFLSVAGGVARMDFLSLWWAAMIESGRVARADVPAALEKIWREPAGDRRQELVFIGVCLDESSLRAQLDGCLA